MKFRGRLLFEIALALIVIDCQIMLPSYLMLFNDRCQEPVSDQAVHTSFGGIVPIRDAQYVLGDLGAWVSETH